MSLGTSKTHCGIDEWALLMTFGLCPRRWERIWVVVGPLHHVSRVTWERERKRESPENSSASQNIFIQIDQSDRTPQECVFLLYVFIEANSHFQFRALRSFMISMLWTNMFKTNINNNNNNTTKIENSNIVNIRCSMRFDSRTNLCYSIYIWMNGFGLQQCRFLSFGAQLHTRHHSHCSCCCCCFCCCYRRDWTYVRHIYSIYPGTYSKKSNNNLAEKKTKWALLHRM